VISNTISDVKSTIKNDSFLLLLQ